MRILDRYVLTSVLRIFVGCLLTFLFLYIIIDVFTHLEDILKQHVSLLVLKDYYLSFLPIIFVQVAPFTCLLSTLYTFGSLNHNNEIIAMRSAGLSIFQITRVVLVFGVMISILVFYVNDRFVPQSSYVADRIRAQMEQGEKKAQEKENETVSNLCMFGMKNRLFFVNKFSPSKNMMERIVILEQDEHQNITKKIVANKGIYEDGLWRFYQSITYDFDENGQIIKEPQYMQEEIMNISDTPHDFLTQRKQPEFMDIAQLEDYIWRFSKSGATTIIRNLKVDLYQKFTSPLTSIIVILLGIPFSVMMKKRATGLSSLGISIMLGFLYYVLSAVGIALGKAGILAPLLSVSLSHIIALTAAICIIRTLP